MTEHEKLKEICNEIIYSPTYFTFTDYWIRDDEILWLDGSSEPIYRYIDVREIIFTQDFMDKFEKHYNWYWEEWDMYWRNRLLDNLDTPVEYLHSLIFNK